MELTREQALALLQKYNKEPFHIQHALTVEGVMRWFANELGYGDEADFWATVGLLHDIDFENWPEEHCIKAPELLREAGFDERFIHAVCSHAYGMTSDVEPEHIMELNNDLKKAMFDEIEEINRIIKTISWRCKTHYFL